MTSTRDFGKKPELAWLPVEALYVDSTYQRTMESKRSKGLIARMTEDFHWPSFGALLVAPALADGIANRYAVVDGQHRLSVARALGFDEVPCVIVRADTVEAQAMAFLRANKDRVVVNQFAVFHASVKAGDPKAMAVADVCLKSDVDIPRYQIAARFLKPNQTLAIGTIATAIATHGPEIAIACLTAIRGAFPNDQALRAYVIRGIAECFALDQRVKIDGAVAVLAKWGFAEFEDQVWSYHMSGPKYQAVRAALHGAMFPRHRETETAKPHGVQVREQTRPILGIKGKTQAPDPTKPFVSAFDMPIAKPKGAKTVNI